MRSCIFYLPEYSIAWKFENEEKGGDLARPQSAAVRRNIFILAPIWASNDHGNDPFQ